LKQGAMEYFDNLDGLNDFIQTYFRKGTATNNYFLADSYLKHIENKKLGYVATQENAVMLLEKHDFYQLYYFINNFAADLPILDDRPVVMEIIYRGEKNKPITIINYWASLGFKLHLTRDNMIANIEKHLEDSNPVYELNLKYAETRTELLYIENLLATTLDKYTGDLLTTDDLNRFLENRNFICATYKGELAGVLQFEIKNKVIWLGHIAVDEHFRGKGIAKELVKKYIADNCSEGYTRFQLWVIQENVGALNLYRKFGFVYGGKTTTSMLKMNS
jgi:ribosomal protein S18 acetylase RimI-like enzyme